MAHPAFFAFRRPALVLLGFVLAVSGSAAPGGRQTLRGHVPKAVSELKSLGALAETNRLQLSLGLPLRHPAELAAYLREVYNPSSAQFHHFLKPGEFAGRFGPTEEDYAAVHAFAQAHGLRVVHTHPNRLLLDVEGSVAAVKQAFHVNMNVFPHPKEGRTFFAPDAEPSVEAGVPLLHVSGLDNYQLPKPNFLVRSPSNPSHENSGSGPGGTFMGRDFRAAYAPGVTLDGAGQTVALVEFDTFYPSDITAYENTNNLPNVPVSTVPIDGFNGPPGGGQGEVDLDIEMSIAMAPGLSQVNVYEAAYGTTSVNDDLLNQIAMDDSANQIACCWLFAIDAETDIIFQQMAAQGQSFFTACGDGGAWDVDMPPLQGDPYITVVGGTTLTTAGPGGRWLTETVWNGFTSHGYFPGAAGSGGISMTYPIPYWQQSVNMSLNQGSTVWRNVPDVALTADQIWIIADGGQSETVGGTSCATPLWAAFTALINQQAAQNGRPPVGFLNPAIYGAAQSSLYPTIFHDITTGNNTNSNSSLQFFAEPGFDLCTGWGTPAGQALINALAPPDSLILTPSGGASFIVTNGVALAGLTQTLNLSNAQNTTVDWVIGHVPSWLGVSGSQGTLSNSQNTSLTLSVNSFATNLPPGALQTDILVTNQTSGVTHIYPVFLQIADPLIIAPGSGFASAGPVGGPFAPASQTFSLSNAATVPINWTAQSTSSFAGFSPANGTLPPGTASNITATLDPSANNLLISAQSGNLLFTDLNTSNTQSQAFTLAVGNGGFETGDFSDWTFSGNANDSFADAVTNLFTDYVHSGEFAAILGEPNGLGSLSQTLPTTPGQRYFLSLFFDNPVGGTPNEFEVKWGSSVLFIKLSVAQMFWTNLQYVVTANSATTTLQFVFRNDPDAFGLDDISVTLIVAPTFSSVTTSNSAIVFQWSATPGFLYQLQYTTNLAPPAWSNSGPRITASNSVVTASDTQHTDPQRFYRIISSVP